MSKYVYSVSSIFKRGSRKKRNAAPGGLANLPGTILAQKVLPYLPFRTDKEEIDKLRMVNRMFCI